MDARATLETGASRNPANPSSRSATCTAKGSTVEALCLGTLPSAGRMDAEPDDLKDPMRTQRFGHVGHQGSHLVAEALGPRPESFGEVLEDADLVLDGGDEAHVVTPVDLALFEQRKDVALDPRTDVVRLKLRDQDGAADIDVVEPVLEDRDHELFLRTEVVLDRRVVAAPRRSADLAERDAFVAAFGKEPLGRENDLLFGRERDCRRRHHLATSSHETTPLQVSQVT